MEGILWCSKVHFAAFRLASYPDSSSSQSSHPVSSRKALAQEILIPNFSEEDRNRGLKSGSERRTKHPNGKTERAFRFYGGTSKAADTFPFPVVRRLGRNHPSVLRRAEKWFDLLRFFSPSHFPTVMARKIARVFVLALFRGVTPNVSPALLLSKKTVLSVEIASCWKRHQNGTVSDWERVHLLGHTTPSMILYWNRCMSPCKRVTSATNAHVVDPFFRFSRQCPIYWELDVRFQAEFDTKRPLARPL